MVDEIIKQTGNSRYMKSNIAANATWEQVRDLLRAGTFPFDFNGKNPAGIAQMGTELSKAVMLSDIVVSKLGLSGEDATPNNAFDMLFTKGAKFQQGKYIGTGTSGRNNQNKIDCDFKPMIAIINGIGSVVNSNHTGSVFDGDSGFGVFTNSWNYSFVVSAGRITIGTIALSTEGKSMFWYYRDSMYVDPESVKYNSDGNPTLQLNKLNVEYEYIVIGQ